MFSINQSSFLHKTNIYLRSGFEFEFGPQRIRDLAFVCSYSLDRYYTTECSGEQLLQSMLKRRGLKVGRPRQPPVTARRLSAVGEVL